jgi:hypothetical protein
MMAQDHPSPKLKDCLTFGSEFDLLLEKNSPVLNLEVSKVFNYKNKIFLNFSGMLFIQIVRTKR